LLVNQIHYAIQLFGFRSCSPIVQAQNPNYIGN
jgi:hypothetical protein